MIKTNISLITEIKRRFKNKSNRRVKSEREKGKGERMIEGKGEIKNKNKRRGKDECISCS